jgi:hypothetical protein
MQTIVDTLATDAAVVVRRYLRSVNSNLFVWRALREAHTLWDIVRRGGLVADTPEGLMAYTAAPEGILLLELIEEAKRGMLVNENGVATPVKDVMIDAAVLHGWCDTRTFPLPPVGDLYCGFSGEAARAAVESLRFDWELETAELGAGLFGAEPDPLQSTVAALLRAKGPAHPIYEAALVPTRPYILAHPAILQIYALFTLSVYHDYRTGGLAAGTSLYTNRDLAADLAEMDTVTALRHIFVAVVREDIAF